MFDFQASFDGATLQAMIRDIAYIGKGTATGAALTLTVNELLSSSASGYRMGAVPLVAVVVTDGATQETQASCHASARS